MRLEKTNKKLQAKSSDFSAGYFCTGISRRLCGEVIRVVMNDYCFSDYFVNCKSVCEEELESKAVVCKKRRQIACMVWVETISRIVVSHRIRKWVA